MLLADTLGQSDTLTTLYPVPPLRKQLKTSPHRSVPPFRLRRITIPVLGQILPIVLQFVAINDVKPISFLLSAARLAGNNTFRRALPFIRIYLMLTFPLPNVSSILPARLVTVRPNRLMEQLVYVRGPVRREGLV